MPHSLGLRSLNPLTFQPANALFASRQPKPGRFNDLPLHSNANQKVSDTRYTFMLFSRVFANQNHLCLTSPAPAAPRSRHTRQGPKYWLLVRIPFLSFHALTNCLPFPPKKQTLSFHALTNCYFRKSFLFTFMHRWGGRGYLRCSGQSSDWCSSGASQGAKHGSKDPPLREPG